MALPTVNGTLNPLSQTIEPNNSATWADLSTWESWSSWTAEPVDPLIWITDMLDLGETQDFTLTITTVANGEVSYKIYTSTTGAFAGEETETVVASGATGVTGFNGRYVLIAVYVARTQGVNNISDVQLRATGFQVQIKLNDIDTSTLAGTSSARTLVLPRTVSRITNMTITPKELASAYAVDLYVSSTPNSTQLIPKIVNKSIASPQIALTGIDNQPRDGVVDIDITALPEMYMSGNNLLIR